MLKKIKAVWNKLVTQRVKHWSENPRFIIAGIIWDSVWGTGFLFYGLYLLLSHRHDYLWGTIEILFAGFMAYILILNLKILKRYNFASEAYHFLKFIDEYQQYQNAHGSGKARADIPFSTKR